MADNKAPLEIGSRPLNPFVETDKSKLDDLSDLQKKLFKFIEDEANVRSGQNYGVQPPAIKVFGPEAERLRLENEKKQKEFFEKYQITKDEHDILVDLIFYGEVKLPFKSLGHTFLIRDLTPETKRYVTNLSRRNLAQKEVNHLKIAAVSEALSEIDGIALHKNFLEKFLWKMQINLLDLIFKMHLLTETYKLYLYEKLPNFVRTPTSRIRYAICRDINMPINDTRFREMSDEQIYWHYINSIKHEELESKILDNRMDYLAWFINPEMSKKLHDKKEMHEEADLNLIQKYSFMNGIMDMVKKDMKDDQLSATMETLMYKMKSTTENTEKDPWEIPKEMKIDENDPFIQALKRTQVNTEPPKQDTIAGMIGGSDEWYEE